MKILKRILSIVGILIIILLLVSAGVWVYYGGLKTIVFSNPQQGGEILVYKEVIGDYMKSGDISEEVYYDLMDMGIETFIGFGIFYDDPSEVPTEKRRSEIGCVLEQKDIDKIPEIEKKFKVKTFPVGQYTSTDFSYKGMPSIFVGMMKVYPAIQILKKESKELYKEGPIMELYNMKDSVITYRLCGNYPVEIKAKKVKMD